MSNFSSNLRFLRKQKGLTQQQFADSMDIKRSLVGAYEEDRAEPKYDLLKKFASFFDLSMDEILNEQINEKWKPREKTPENKLRILSITVDKEDRENIEMVPVKASAGYLNGYADPEFISELPKFSLPMFRQGTYRAFETKGDSMLPLPSGTVIIGEYVENWNDLKSGETYVFITQSEGVVYKRAGSKFRDNKGIKLISDNPVYEPYVVAAEDILEIWKAKAYISTEFPEPSPEPSIESLTTMVAQMQKSLSKIQDERQD